MVHISEISEKFGMQALEMQELPHGLFLHFGFGLRFELAGDVGIRNETRIPTFLLAIDRARAITAAVLPVAQNVTVMLSQSGYKRAKTGKRRLRSQLKELGLDTSTLDYAGTVAQEDQFHIADFGRDRYRHWFTLRPTTSEDIDRLIWGCVSLDIDVEPRLKEVDVYMLDLEREIILQVYDDRGMDVVATNLQVLRPFYRKFADWILDYDREQIDTVFKTRQPIRKFGPVEARRWRQSRPPWVEL